MNKILFLLFVCQYSFAQVNRNNTSIADYNVKGLHELENLISETSLKRKPDMHKENSFVKHFKIKAVEQFEISNSKENKLFFKYTYF